MKNKMTKYEMYRHCTKHEWIVSKNGKKFIKYAGLLFIAHEMGLQSVISVPVYEDYEKGRFCFKATVKGFKTIETEEGNKTFECIFQDEGDASLNNTNKMIHPHIRRMASTRAIVRALRLYTGVGMTAFEELND